MKAKYQGYFNIKRVNVNLKFTLTLLFMQKYQYFLNKLKSFFLEINCVKINDVLLMHL